MHLWLRAESRPNERRTGLMPGGARWLIARGADVTVERSGQRCVPLDAYRAAGCAVAPEGGWRDAPSDALILGLKELPDDGTPLVHRHIMFGHAFKGQPAGRRLLARFRAGGGRLYDLEYLADAEGRRVAAFGYWAGYAGAAVALGCWAAQKRGGNAGPVAAYGTATALRVDLEDDLARFGSARPDALIVGAAGRVGTGAAALCEAVGVPVTRWDMAETAHGGPFPEVLDHDVFLNCVLAGPGTPVFVPPDAGTRPRRLTVVGDIACDPESDFNPVPVYDRATTWERPATRVAHDPPLDVMAIDNLPALLPLEASEDFAAQLLPHLGALDRADTGVWARAAAVFDAHVAKLA